MQNNLNRIFIFIKVVEKQSFTAAAEALSMNKSVVSRHINLLEEELGTKLLHRTTRKIKLTEAGEHYFEQCSILIQELEKITTQTQMHQEEPNGRIRVSTTFDFGTAKFTSIVSSFIKKFPKVDIDLILTDQKLDMIENQLDFVIRVGWPKDSSMISTKIGSTRQLLCASPNYFKNEKIPKKPSELVNHNWITLSVLPNKGKWIFTNSKGRTESVTVKGNISTNTSIAARNLVNEGLGFSVFTEFTVEDLIKNGEMINLLKNYTLEDVGIYVIYPSKKHLPLKVRKFIDHIKEEL